MDRNELELLAACSGAASLVVGVTRWRREQRTADCKTMLNNALNVGLNTAEYREEYVTCAELVYPTPGEPVSQTTIAVTIAGVFFAAIVVIGVLAIALRWKL